MNLFCVIASLASVFLTILSLLLPGMVIDSASAKYTVFALAENNFAGMSIATNRFIGIFIFAAIAGLIVLFSWSKVIGTGISCASVLAILIPTLASYIDAVTLNSGSSIKIGAGLVTLILSGLLSVAVFAFCIFVYGDFVVKMPKAKSSGEEIAVWYDLLTQKIITQQEFDSKKKEFLDL